MGLSLSRNEHSGIARLELQSEIQPETKACICPIPVRSARVQHLICALTFVRVPDFTVFVFCIQDTRAKILYFHVESCHYSHSALRCAL